MSAHLLEFNVPEIADVVSGTEKFKTAAKNVGRHTLKKKLGTGCRKRTASSVIAKKSAKQISRSRRDFFYKHFSIFMSNNFRYQPFVAVSGNVGGKIPVVDDVLLSHDQEKHPTTSTDQKLHRI